MLKRPNVIVVMLDTMRADALRCCGGRDGLPNIDRLAGKGKVYANVVAPGTYTVPSHVSLFLGKRVRSVKTLTKDPLKNYDNLVDPFLTKSKFIKSGENTLARQMSYLGYETALFSNNPFLTNTTGLGEGFGSVKNLWIDNKINKNRKSVKLTLGVVDNKKVRNSLLDLTVALTRLVPRDRLDRLYLNLRTRLNKHFSSEYGFYDLDKGALETNREVERYLNGKEGGNMFMFINYMEMHEGYPTRLITKDYVEQDKWLYMSGVIDDGNAIETIKKAYTKRAEHLDAQIGSLLWTLKNSGALDNTVLVLASDHGQAFMEHGTMYHNMFPHNEVSHVPMIAARFIDGRQVDTKERITDAVSLTSLNGAMLDIAYGKTDMINGNMRSDNYVFSDHVGITEVWDTYLLQKLRHRSKTADAVYRTKKKCNTFATAIYHGDKKLIHYYAEGMKDELYDLSEDPGETVNTADSNTGKETINRMLKANELSVRVA